MVVQELSSTQKERRGHCLHTGIVAPARSAGARIWLHVFFHSLDALAGAPRRCGDSCVQDLSSAVSLCAEQFLHYLIFDSRSLFDENTILENASSPDSCRYLPMHLPYL